MLFDMLHYTPLILNEGVVRGVATSRVPHSGGAICSCSFIEA